MLPFRHYTRRRQQHTRERMKSDVPLLEGCPRTEVSGRPRSPPPAVGRAHTGTPARRAGRRCRTQSHGDEAKRRSRRGERLEDGRDTGKCPSPALSSILLYTPSSGQAPHPPPVHTPRTPACRAARLRVSQDTVYGSGRGPLSRTRTCVPSHLVLAPPRSDSNFPRSRSGCRSAARSFLYRIATPPHRRNTVPTRVASAP